MVDFIAANLVQETKNSATFISWVDLIAYIRVQVTKYPAYNTYARFGRF